MFPDDLDLEPFDPFHVGPPNSGARSEFKIPTCVTYPPPVFEVKPDYVKAAKKQEALRQASGISLPKSEKSQFGEVAISKAIKEEMTLAKKQAERIDAGQVSKIKLGEDLRSKETIASQDSVQTLLPVRSKRGSQFIVEGQVNTSETEMSVASNTSKMSQISNKSSRVSQVSQVQKKHSMHNTLALKSILKGQKKSLEKVEASVTTIKSKPSETGTLRSVKSKASEKTLTSKQSNIEAKQVKSKISTISQKPQKVESMASKASLKSQAKVPVAAEVPKKDKKMHFSSKTSLGKSLTEQAADLAHRLNAGNENFRRYNSVIRNHSTNIPKKRNHGDRMTFWFSDAVLS
ncbi:hypothetical protein KR018_008278 [Drosophila ironensis]|nr:hypothetical protein KR018_008278 [Drosophila ironensis]